LKYLIFIAIFIFLAIIFGIATRFRRLMTLYSRLPMSVVKILLIFLQLSNTLNSSGWENTWLSDIFRSLDAQCENGWN